MAEGQSKFEEDEDEEEKFGLDMKKMIVNQNRKKKKSGGFQVMGKMMGNIYFKAWCITLYSALILCISKF